MGGEGSIGCLWEGRIVCKLACFVSESTRVCVSVCVRVRVFACARTKVHACAGHPAPKYTHAHTHDHLQTNVYILVTACTFKYIASVCAWTSVFVGASHLHRSNELTTPRIINNV